MNQQDLAVCYCIIGHPKKPKFMAVQHTDGWMPPTLRFPPGPVDFRAHMINEGMHRKYGLRTRVLRSLIQLPNYHCMELELPAGGGNKQLKAVWVGREEYQQFRAEQPGFPDPFLRWLDERETGGVPDLRPTWQIPGFTRSAENWIRFQVDRLGLHLNGEIQQVRAGSGDSCILRARVHDAWVYFKAGRESGAGEAGVTQMLAEQWPEQVTRPLAVETRRNWMLYEDQGGPGEAIDPERAAGAAYAGFAQSLALVQTGSVSCLDQWENLGLPRHGLSYLQGLISQKSDLRTRLQEGNSGLNSDAFEGFCAAMDAAGECCRGLAERGLPDMIVHTAFGDESMVMKGHLYQISNWADAVIAHPFMSLSRMFEEAASVRSGRSRHAYGSKDEDILRAFVDSYLQSFTVFAPLQDLRDALDQAQELFPLWRFSRLLHALEGAEIASPQYVSLIVRLQRAARAMITAG